MNWQPYIYRIEESFSNSDKIVIFEFTLESY